MCIIKCICPSYLISAWLDINDNNDDDVDAWLDINGNNDDVDAPKGRLIGHSRAKSYGL